MSVRIASQAAWHRMETGPKAENGKKDAKKKKMAQGPQWGETGPTMAKNLIWGHFLFIRHFWAIFSPFRAVDRFLFFGQVFPFSARFPFKARPPDSQFKKLFMLSTTSASLARKTFWAILEHLSDAGCPVSICHRKRAEYCFENTFSEERTHWASLSFGANSVSSAKNLVSSLCHANNRLRGLTEFWPWNGMGEEGGEEGGTRREIRGKKGQRKGKRQGWIYGGGRGKKRGEKGGNKGNGQGKGGNWWGKTRERRKGKGGNGRKSGDEGGETRGRWGQTNSLSSVFETVLSKTVFGPVSDVRP